MVPLKRLLVTFLTANRCCRSDGAATIRPRGTIAAMRLLDVDIDLILLTLTVLLTVGAMEPPTQPSLDVPIICIETACYPTPLVSP